MVFILEFDAISLAKTYYTIHERVPASANVSATYQPNKGRREPGMFPVRGREVHVLFSYGRQAQTYFDRLDGASFEDEHLA
jgi:hypothetical protein